MNRSLAPSLFLRWHQQSGGIAVCRPCDTVTPRHIPPIVATLCRVPLKEEVHGLECETHQNATESCFHESLIEVSGGAKSIRTEKKWFENFLQSGSACSKERRHAACQNCDPSSILYYRDFFPAEHLHTFAILQHTASLCRL